MANDGLSIFPLKRELIQDINETNDAFDVFGRLVPSLKNGVWSYEELLFEEMRSVCFPDDQLDWSRYIDNEERALFLAYKNNHCVGQIRIMKDWNRFCYIENIAVKKEYRRNGIAVQLLNQAEAWAMHRNLIGFSLEAQDDNLGACRYYIKKGFKLGGVDTMKQTYNPNIDTTLYWYKPF